MTTPRRLQLAASAGEPDSVLSRRIDVVMYAVALVEAWAKFGTTTKHENLEKQEYDLLVAVRRYKAALKNRRKAQVK